MTSKMSNQNKSSVRIKREVDIDNIFLSLLTAKMAKKRTSDKSRSITYPWFGNDVKKGFKMLAKNCKGCHMRYRQVF